MSIHMEHKNTFILGKAKAKVLAKNSDPGFYPRGEGAGEGVSCQSALGQGLGISIFKHQYCAEDFHRPLEKSDLRIFKT